MSVTGDAITGIGILVDIAGLIARELGKSTAEVLAEAAADCERRAKDPTDETESVLSEIDEHMPRTRANGPDIPRDLPESGEQ
jgi:hypothetical protein